MAKLLSIPIFGKKRCKSERYSPSFQKARKCTFSLFASALLLLFLAVSCRQQAVVQEDNEYLMNMIREAAGTLQHNPDSLIVFLDAIRHNYGELMTYSENVTFYNLRGAANYWQREFEIAETYYLKALQFAEKLNDGDGDWHRQVIIINNIASARVQSGNSPGALDAFRQIRTLLDKHQDTERLLALYIGKGGVFATMGNTDSALYYTGLAIATAIAEGFRAGEAVGLGSLANIFFNLGNYPQAEENYRQAALIFEEIDDLRSLMITYNNLASTTAAQDRLEESLSYAQKFNEIATEIGAPAVGMNSYYARRGEIYLEGGSYRRSLEMFYRALALLTQWQDIRMIAGTKSSISAAYNRLGDFNRAIYYANEALRVAYENDISHLQLEIYRNLLFIHAMRGDMDSFTTSMEAEQTLRDALFAEQSNRALHEMQVRYETERRDMMIAQQKEAIRRKGITLVWIIFGGAVIIILLVFNHILQREKVRTITRIVQHYETSLKLRKEVVEHKIELKVDTAEKDLKRSEMSEKLFPEIERLFKEEKVYKQPKLLVDDVAKMLNTNRNYLSTAINECYGKRFSEFINTFRVDDTVEMLKESHEGGKYANYTIQAIGEEVGFIGKNTFHIAFKQIIGVTPSEYLKALDSKRQVA
jgi:tetratricopeptide (TPR) repeat protein